MRTTANRQIMKIATTLFLFVALACHQTEAWWFSSSSSSAARSPSSSNSSSSSSTNSSKELLKPKSYSIDRLLNEQGGSTSEKLKEQQQGVRAIARLDMNGVKGAFKFSQRSPTEPTLVEYDLTGLKGNNRLYHVHVHPLPSQQFGHSHSHVHHQHLPQQPRNTSNVCDLAGGHLNPYKVPLSHGLPPQSAPIEKYEVGDLRGKHGPMRKVAGEQDHYKGHYSDPQLPMSGEGNIVGRSVVIHKNDGVRWVCATIVRERS